MWPCHKRVDANGFCPSCSKQGKVVVRVAIRCEFTDCSGAGWFTTFHDAAQQVLGLSAEVLKRMAAEDPGNTKLEALLRERYFNQLFQLTLKVKRESYQGRDRNNVVCTDARRLESAEYGWKLLRQVREMLI